MQSNKQFDNDKAYNSIDDWNYGYIDRKNLRQFLKKHGYFAKNQEVMAIIRRMDLDGDARLSKQEFMAALIPEAPYSKLMRQRSSSKHKSSTLGNRRKSTISRYSYRPDELLKLSS